VKVETEELLPIGRFARLSGLTVKALRHYDELGLLRPAHVDGWTGYRFYRPDQAAEAIAIRRLRELELPLEDVAVALQGSAELRERLAVHRARLEGRAAETRQLLTRLDLLIEGKEPLVPQLTVNPKLEDVPALHVAVIAAHVPVDRMFSHVPTTIMTVSGWLDRKGIPCTGNPLILHLGIEDDSLDVEVGFPIAQPVDGDEVVSVRSYPEAHAAVIEHHGRYEELPSLYGPFEEWIHEHGLTPATPIREQYLTNPSDTPDPDAWVTQIAWPVV